MVWYRPKSVEEAITILNEEKVKIVCGGTDLFVNNTHQYSYEDNVKWLDIQDIDELKKIEQKNNYIEIGAAITAANIWENKDLNLPALKQAAQVVGGWQIQNRASLGGNIANASPAADMVIPLVAYKALVNLVSKEGSRSISIIDFIDGVKSTQMKDNELIVSISIPNEAIDMRQIFLRHDQRGGTDISLVSVTVTMAGSSEKLEALNIAVGAANYKPVMLDNLEAITQGTLHPNQIEEIANLYAQNCSPITDVRASAEYRQAMVKVFVKKAISEILT